MCNPKIPSVKSCANLTVESGMIVSIFNDTSQNSKRTLVKDLELCSVMFCAVCSLSCNINLQRNNLPET